MGFVIHWHESAMDLHVFPIPIPLPTSLSTWSLWVFPVHQPRALVSYIQPGLVICFTLDNIHVSMLFSRNVPASPSPTEPKSLFCTSADTVFKKKKMRVCGDAAWSPSTGTIYFNSICYSVSRCHILVICTIFQTYSLLFSFSWCSVIFDVTIAKRLRLTEGSGDC